MFWPSSVDAADVVVFVDEQLTAMSKKRAEAIIVVHFMIARL
jgi:hypothetical protein